MNFYNISLTNLKRNFFKSIKSLEQKINSIDDIFKTITKY